MLKSCVIHLGVVKDSLSTKMQRVHLLLFLVRSQNYQYNGGSSRAQSAGIGQFNRS